MRPGMSRLALLWALACAVSQFAGCVGVPTNPTTVAEVEQRVSRGVAAGASRESIEAWLDSEHIGHSYREIKPGENYDTAIDSSGLDLASIGGLITVLIEDTDRRFLVQGGINIYFYLDHEGRLIKHRVRWIGTGP